MKTIISMSNTASLSSATEEDVAKAMTVFYKGFSYKRKVGEHLL